MTTTDRDDVPRSGKGKFIRTLEGAERDAEACRMYVAGNSYQDISNVLGYGGRQNAHRAVQGVLLATIKEPAEELRAREVLRAEEIYVMARDIARRDHLTVSHGRVIYVPNPDGGADIPLVDDAPKLSAMDRMLKAMERIAKLKGLDAAVKVQNLTLEEIQRLIAEEEAALAGMEDESQ